MILSTTVQPNRGPPGPKPGAVVACSAHAKALIGPSSERTLWLIRTSPYRPDNRGHPPAAAASHGRTGTSGAAIGATGSQWHWQLGSRTGHAPPKRTEDRVCAHMPPYENTNGRGRCRPKLPCQTVADTIRPTATVTIAHPMFRRDDQGHPFRGTEVLRKPDEPRRALHRMCGSKTDSAIG